MAETPTFIRQCKKLFTEEEKSAVIEHLANFPLSGDEIPGTGGVRKVRVPLAGRGKRGGGRVVYYYFDDEAPIYALLAYPKSQKVDLTPAEAKAVSELAQAIKSAARTKRRPK